MIWSLCALCQEPTGESLKCPATSKDATGIAKIYTDTADLLKRFQEADKLPTKFHSRLIAFISTSNDPGKTFNEENAKWHSSCKNCITKTKLQKLTTSKRKSTETAAPVPIEKKVTRSQTVKFDQNTCFVPGCCSETTEDEPLHEVMSKELDERFRWYASYMNDTELLTKLVAGDLIALEAKYHSSCALMYRNRVRSKLRQSKPTTVAQTIQKFEHQALLKLVSALEVHRYDTGAAPFILTELVSQYESILSESLPNDLEPPARHSTRLKNKLLSQIPDLQYFKKGKQGYMAFNSKITELLHEDIGSNADLEIKTLRDANRILRKHMFTGDHQFDGSLQDSSAQSASVPATLLTFMSHLMGGCSETIHQSILSIAQLVLFNSVKKRRKNASGNPRHQRSRETPIAVYVGLLVHDLTGSQTLIDDLFRLGLSISYDRVQEIRKSLAEQICEAFLDAQVVWAYSLPKSTPKAYGFDNANKISKSTTASGTANFNGTVISVFSFGESQEVIKSFDLKKPPTQRKLKLPVYYTEIQPVAKADYVVPEIKDVCIQGDGTKSDSDIHREVEWLQKVDEFVDSDDKADKDTNVSWASFHAGQAEQLKQETIQTQILPVFTEASNTLAMVKHCMIVIMRAHLFTNPGETPWVTADQPLFALFKTIQWLFPDILGEEHIVGVLGALHTEKAAWTCVGQVEDGCGSTALLAEAEVTTIGVADSCLHCAHISRSRYINTVTACVLYKMLREAYDSYLDIPSDTEKLAFGEWCDVQQSPMFRYHYFLLECKLLVLQFIRSIRTGNFELYLATIVKLAYFFFALDHPNYSRWTPVHIRDMLALSTMHPDVHEHFQQGRFTLNKTGRVFSNIGLDHGQEQNIKKFKHHSGPLSLTHSPDQLLLYLVSGPEVANHVSFFKDMLTQDHQVGICHHEQTLAYQSMFVKHVKSLHGTYLEYGNVFMDDNDVLYDISSGTTCPSSAIDSIMSLESNGKIQCEEFVQERLVDRLVPLDKPIKSNKYQLMKERKVAKKKSSEVKDLKNLASTLSQLYVANQVRGGDTLDFFSYENVKHPPSISKDGGLYHGTKSDLVEELLETTENSTVNEHPQVDAIIFDGPVIVHMIPPKSNCTVDEYCNIYMMHVVKFFSNTSRIDIVFDVYLQSSLKEGVRASRGVCPTMITKGNSRIKSWKRFLRNDANKQSLFVSIASYASSITLLPGQQLVVTSRDQVLTNPLSDPIREYLSPCDHEEADSRMILHSHDVLEFASSVVIRTVDTDVLVLAVAAAARCKDKQLFVSFGVGDSQRMIDASAIQKSIGYERALALPVFHAFTGCDTVSSFKSIGKKTAWQRWNTFDDVTEAFHDLCSGPEDVSEDTAKLLERFVILLYDKTSMCTSINQLRKELFTKGRSIEKIPPTSGALLQHDNRSLHQGGQIWGKCHVRELNLADPPPGWMKDQNNKYAPIWTLDGTASEACRQLVKCTCKSKDGMYSCKGRCSCKTIREPCTELCECKGQCIWTKTKRKTLEPIEEEEEDMEDEEDEEQQNERQSDEGEDDNEEMWKGEEDLLFDGLLED